MSCRAQEEGRGHESFHEIIKLDQEEGLKKVEPAPPPRRPGEDNCAVAELEPGEYAVVCFGPVGTTGQGSPGERAPHASQEMKSEFTVA